MKGRKRNGSKEDRQRLTETFRQKRKREQKGKNIKI
jgi:hypothetical protein